MASAIKVKGFNQLKKKMERLGHNLTVASANAMLDEAKMTAKLSQENIEKADLINFRNLIESLYISPIIRVKDGWKVEVGYISQHAAYEHEGWDSQSMPPLEELEQWVVTKLRIPYPEATWVAYAIGLNLSLNGHKATPFLEQAKEETERYYNKKIAYKIKSMLLKVYGKKG